MALFIVRFQDTSQFSVASHVESSIGGKHNQSGAAVSPANHILHTNPQLYRTEGKMPLKMTLGRTVLLKCEPRTLVQTTSSYVPESACRDRHFRSHHAEEYIFCSACGPLLLNHGFVSDHICFSLVSHKNSS